MPVPTANPSPSCVCLIVLCTKARKLSLYENGHLPVHVAEAIPFSRATEAHRLIETGHVRGKIVLVR